MRRSRFRRQISSGQKVPQRIFIAQIVIGLLFFGILARLFTLQVINGEEYYNEAIRQRTREIKIPAKRGEILVRDTNTGDLIKMATNTTLDLVYVDPKETPDKQLVAKTLAPLLYTDQDHAACLEEAKFCPTGSVEILQEEVIQNGEAHILSRSILPTREKAIRSYEANIFRKINREKVDFVLLKREVTDEEIQSIQEIQHPAIEILLKKSLIGVDPTKISDQKKERETLSKQLAKALSLNADDVFYQIRSRDIRYVMLKNKIRPEISEKIKDLQIASYNTHKTSQAEIFSKKIKIDPIPDFFGGVVLVPEHWRYYPDKNIAAQILGYVNHEGHGQYGIEEKFDKLLAGKKGIIRSQNDVLGAGITPEIIQTEENGVSLVLTIDRILQKKVEDVLEEAMKKFRADSGQVIVMNPKTGRILALANAPSFNPNEFGQALQVRRTTPEDSKNIFATTPLFVLDEYDRLQRSTFEEFQEQWQESFNPEFYIYRNTLGPGAFVNRTVQETYEPGSVFKPLVMAVGLETGEIRPNTTFLEDGPVQVGTFTIHTALGEYNGIQTMTNILETSSNVGMVFVALKLGKSVLHNALVHRFGFGDYTDVDLAEETPGKVFPKKDWSDARLLTASFGQGLTTTPIQIVRAWGAMANGGVMMKPQIIQEKIHANGTHEEVRPEEVRRVLSPDTATTITGMLTSGVNNGVAYPAKIPGYNIAGKTGTSQIAGKDGKYETGQGSFITSFAGYAPSENPQFVVYVKFDRPRYGEDRTWGSTTAAPVFREVMEYALKSANILPVEGR